MIKREKAFTLSELLITMSIVGVIAVLTVPNVMKNIFKDSYYSKALATQEIMSKAINQMLVDERLTDLEDSSLLTNKEKFFTEYIKITKNCNNSPTDCMATLYKTPTETKNVEALFGATDRYYTIFANGASVAALTGGEIPEGGVYFLVDANGKAAPNVFGVDTYMFPAYSNASLGDLNNGTITETEAVEPTSDY